MFLAWERGMSQRGARKKTLYSVSFVISILRMVYISFSISTSSSLVAVVLVAGASQTRRGGMVR
jgi:hypothetical protein